jgi:hypothetical protein
MSTKGPKAASAPPSPNLEARILETVDKKITEANAALHATLVAAMTQAIEAANQSHMEKMREMFAERDAHGKAQHKGKEDAGLSQKPSGSSGVQDGVPPKPNEPTVNATAATAAVSSSGPKQTPAAGGSAPSGRDSFDELRAKQAADPIRAFVAIEELNYRLKTEAEERTLKPAAAPDRPDRAANDHKTLQQMIPRWDGSADTFPSFRLSVEYAFKHAVKEWSQEQKVEYLSRAGIADKAEGIYKQLPTEGKTVDMFLNDLSSIANLTTETESQWSNLTRNNDAFNVFAARASAIHCRRNNSNKCDDAVLIDRLICSLSPEINNAVRMHFRALHNGKDAPITFANLVSCVMSFEMGKAQTRRTAGIGHVNAISESSAEADAAAASKALQNISALTTQAVQAQTGLLATMRDLQARVAAMPMATQPPAVPYAYRQQQQQYQQQPQQQYQQQYQQQPQQQYAAARVPTTRGGPQTTSTQPATFFAGNCRACKGFGHKAQDCPLHQVMSIERVHEMMAQNIAEEDDQVAAVDQSDAALAAIDPVHSNVTRRL